MEKFDLIAAMNSLGNLAVTMQQNQQGGLIIVALLACLALIFIFG